MDRFSLQKRWGLVSLLVAANSSYGFETPGVSAPLNPQSIQECSSSSSEWKRAIDAADNAVRSCEAREGPKIKAKNPPYMPNCGRHQQAWWTCAPYSDEVCRLQKAQNAAFKDCADQVHAAQKMKESNRKAEAEDKKGFAERVMNGVGEAKRVKGELEGFVASPVEYGIGRLTKTPGAAGGAFNSAAADAARKAGAPGADSQPLLNKVGELSDKGWRELPGNSIAKEVGAQSLAASRAKMGDALDQMQQLDKMQFPNQGPGNDTGRDLASKVAESQRLLQVRSQQESQLRLDAELASEERAERNAQIRRERETAVMLQSMLPGATSSYSGGGRDDTGDRASRSESSKKAGRQCWSSETVCGAGDSKCIAESRHTRAGLPRCKGG